MDKLTSRQQQAIKTKKRILECAFSLTSEKGFDNVTILDICKSAGVSVGAFYHYFASKEEMILNWYGISDDYFEANVMPSLRSSDDNICQKLVKFAQEQVGVGIVYGSDHIAQLYRAQLLYNSLDFYSSKRGIVSGIHELIQCGQQSGELKDDVSVEQLAHELLTIIRGVVLDWLWGGTNDPKSDVARMTKIYLSSYLKNQ